MAILEFAIEPNLGAYEIGTLPPLYPPDAWRPLGLPSAPLDIPLSQPLRIHASREGEGVSTFAARVHDASGPGPHTARILARQADQLTSSGTTLRQAVTEAGFFVEVM